MTFLEQAQLLLNELPFDVTITDVTGNVDEIQRVVDLLAAADYQIQNLYLDWNFLWTTHAGVTLVAGTSEYSAPSDLGDYDLESFFLDYTSNDFKNVKHLNYKDWRNNYGYGVKTNAKSDFFTIKPDNTIVLEPPPDDAYTLTYDYLVEPTKMSAKTDESTIPERYHRVAIARAKVWWANQEDMQELLADANSEFSILFPQLKAAELPGQSRNARADPEMLVQITEW